VATAPSGDGARGATTALDSAFRRRWTVRKRIEVTVLGTLAALVLRLVHLTLRVRWLDAGDIVARHRRGERFVFATWHDGLMLLPLVLRGAGAEFRPRILISWHRDAEIGAQAGRWFGARFVRGSTTRGGIGAIRGLLTAFRDGEDVLVVSDGPRGPRHQAKPGIVQLGRATGVPVVPIVLGVAPCRRLGSWDRMQVPILFGRVAIRFGDPVEVGDDDREGQARLQAAMDAGTREVERALGATS